MARLFTVIVAAHNIPHAGRDFARLQVYEADFAGLHFSRTNEATLKHWVRVAARNRYGKDTQVIFLHTEGSPLCLTPNHITSSSQKTHNDSSTTKPWPTTSPIFSA